MPSELIFNCVRNSEENQFQLYLYLNITNSGKVKADHIDYEEIGRILGIKTPKTIRTHLENLVKRNWIGYSKKSDTFFIRGFDKVGETENIKTKSAAVFTIEYFSHFKAWCGAVLYAYLYKKSWWSKYKEPASKLEKAKQALNTAPLFLPIATTGFSIYFDISVAQASKLKKLAFDAGYLDVRKNYTNTTIPLEQKELFKKYGDSNIANRIRVKDGSVVLQQIDTILPHIALSKRKNWKT